MNLSLDSRTVRGTWLVFIAALSLFALAAPANAVFPGANGKIGFTDGFGCCNSHVYTINRDGTGQTTLGGGVDPAWSADGRKIAYVNGVGHLATMNADGSGKTDLGIGGVNGTDFSSDLTDPAWSPDGKHIAYSEFFCYPDNSCTNFLWIVNADGTGKRGITSGGADPAWSPDGQWIAFAEGTCDPSTGSFGICKVHPDGTGLSPLFVGPAGDCVSPDWSPDGTEIVFSCTAGYTGTIMKARADGTGSSVVRAGRFDGDGYHSETAWSPDGTKIAFTTLPPSFSSREMHVMNSDGSGEAPLTTQVPPPGVTEPSWQPIPNQPPDCSHVTASPDTLWRPNRRLVSVSLSGATDPDGDQVTLTITGVTQDEPTRGKADATLGPASNQVGLRATRLGRGDGRVYRIAFTASDGRRGECSGTATVGVPRKKNRAAVDSAPPRYDSLGH